MYRNQLGERARRRFAVFLLFSVCLHAAVLVRIAVAPRPVYRVESPLSVSLSLTTPETNTPAPVATA
ncbi:MAG: hypothetical protein ACJ8KA_10355, partial [Sulfurifustis sp.]